MFTDSIAGTAVAVKAAVPYVATVMRRHGWRPQTADHIVIHQTSESSLNDAMLAINRVFGKSAAHPGNTIFNLAERGNTASTSHWVALKDHILSNRIQSGDRTVFGISGSGQTVGAALYTFDDLPDRLRRGSNGRRAAGLSTGRRVRRTSVRHRVCVSQGWAPFPRRRPRLRARWQTRYTPPRRASTTAESLRRNSVCSSTPACTVTSSSANRRSPRSSLATSAPTTTFTEPTAQRLSRSTYSTAESDS